MRKEKMNIRKRVKETLALALSLLMVLGVISIPIHTDAAPNLPDGFVGFEGEQISFDDGDYYLFYYSVHTKASDGTARGEITPTSYSTSVSGGGTYYYNKPVVYFPHYE